jgi:hypothetical protein
VFSCCNGLAQGGECGGVSGRSHRLGLGLTYIGFHGSRFILRRRAGAAPCLTHTLWPRLPVHTRRLARASLARMRACSTACRMQRGLPRRSTCGATGQ